MTVDSPNNHFPRKEKENRMNDLNNLRNKIDGIDEQTVKLLEQRFDVVKDIAKYKKERGLDVFDKTREAEVLQKISDRVNNQEYLGYILKIYAEIFEAGKSLQYKNLQKPY